MDFDQIAIYCDLALTWIGFGTVVGLAMIGCAVLQYFSATNVVVKPVSIEGFAVGSGGALVLLIFYKVLGGYWFIEGETTSRRRRRQRYDTVYDD